MSTIGVSVLMFFCLGLITFFAYMILEVDSYPKNLRIILKISAVGMALVIGVFFFGWSGINPDYSRGVRDGMLYKVSEKGLLYKSTESEMNLGSVVSGAATTWDFSTRDSALSRDLTSNIGKLCKVTYREWLFPPYWFDSEYEVLSIECKAL